MGGGLQTRYCPVRVRVPPPFSPGSQGVEVPIRRLLCSPPYPPRTRLADVRGEIGLGTREQAGLPKDDRQRVTTLSHSAGVDDGDLQDQMRALGTQEGQTLAEGERTIGARPDQEHVTTM